MGEKPANDSRATTNCPCLLPALSIDEDGDLTLQVGECQCSRIGEKMQGGHKKELSYGAFTVCSKALSRASPVMKKMLYGGFSESKNSGNHPWTIRLPGDNPKALEVILNIIHLRFDQVSSSVTTFDDIYDITVLTDKYDLTRVIRPWVGEWRNITMEGKLPQLASQTIERYFEKRLWIALELGNLNDFYNFIAFMSFRSCINSDGMLEHRDLWALNSYKRLHDFPEPLEVYETISSTRLRIIEELLTHVDSLVSGLIRRERGKLCCHGGDSYCDATVLGSLIQSLAGAKLWPIPKPSAYDGSPDDLLHSIKTLTVVNSCTFGHCRPTNLSTLQNPIVDKRPRLSDMQERHCSEQGKKSGIEQPTILSLFGSGGAEPYFLSQSRKLF
ncbi:hypothetical protein F4809DRAFT_642080 [Biscogniauxia mediterranea]|nr:hypothetical protein F4809DRAFT_642080 [Biscogniauxia mediterranea]